jgi:hypothetical protein
MPSVFHDNLDDLPEPWVSGSVTVVGLPPELGADGSPITKSDAASGRLFIKNFVNILKAIAIDLEIYTHAQIDQIVEFASRSLADDSFILAPQILSFYADETSFTVSSVGSDDEIKFYFNFSDKRGSQHVVTFGVKRII